MSTRRLGSMRWVAAAVVVALLVGSVGTALIVSTAGDEEPEQTDLATGLDGPAKELAELLEADIEATFHAKYSATSESTPDASIEVETWRDPPRRRQDTSVSSQGQVIVTSVLSDDEGSVRCGRIGDGAWECERLSTSPQDVLVEDIRAQLRGSEVRARDDTVDGRKVRCFTMNAEGRVSEYCATADGIPVRVRAGASRLRLVSLEKDVDGDVFDPPADPIEAQGS